MNIEMSYLLRRSGTQALHSHWSVFACSAAHAGWCCRERGSCITNV